MPEALAVLLVFVVAVAAYASARIHASNPANVSLKAEATRLRDQHAWLQSRLQQAWREEWDQEMVARLADELEATEAQLVRLHPTQRDAA